MKKCISLFLAVCLLAGMLTGAFASPAAYVSAAGALSPDGSVIFDLAGQARARGYATIQNPGYISAQLGELVAEVYEGGSLSATVRCPLSIGPSAASVTLVTEEFTVPQGEGAFLRIYVDLDGSVSHETELIHIGTLPGGGEHESRYAEEIALVKALGIMSGFEDGAFRGALPVTRAELAVIITRLAAKTAYAQGYTGPSAFPDVPSSHWAKGYIQAVSGLGCMKGDANGNFRPEANAATEEAMEALVSLLGYAPVVDPVFGFLDMALELGIYEGVELPASPLLSRALLAKLVTNALEVPLLVRVGMGSAAQYVVYNGSAGTYLQTLLTEKLGVTRLSVAVERTYELEHPSKKNLVLAAIINAHRSKYADGDYDSDVPLRAGNRLDIDAGATGLKGMAGMRAQVYILYDENSDAVPVAVYAKRIQGAQELLVRSDQIAAATPIVYDYNYVTVEYQPEGSTKTEKFRIGSDARLYVNGYRWDFYNAWNLADLLAGGFYGFATFSLENTDSSQTAYDYDTVFISDYRNFVVEEVNTALGRVTAKAGSVSSIIFNENNPEHISILLDQSGNRLDWSALQENDVLAVQRVLGSMATLTTATLVRDTVTGKVDGLSHADEVILINAEEYKASGQGMDYSDFALGYEGIFYLDILGRIAYFEPDRSNDRYAYVLKAGPSAGWEGGFDVALFTDQDTLQIYRTTEEILVNGVLTDAEVFAHGGADSFIAQGNSPFNALFELNSGFKARLIKYTVNNKGLVDSITFANATPFFTLDREAAGSAAFDGERERFQIGGNVYVNDETVILRVKETQGDYYDYAPSDYERLPLASLRNAEETGLTAAAFNVDPRTGVAGIVVVEGNRLRRGYDRLALVADVGVGENSAGTVVESFTVFTDANGGFQPTVLLAAEDAYLPDGIEKGSVIAPLLNQNGEMTDAKLIAGVEEEGSPLLHEVYDRNSYFLGRVTQRRDSRLGLDTGFEEVIPSSANVYLYESGGGGRASAPSVRDAVISTAVLGGETLYYDIQGNLLDAEVYALVVADKNDDITDVVFYFNGESPAIPGDSQTLLVAMPGFAKASVGVFNDSGREMNPVLVLGRYQGGRLVSMERDTRPVQPGGVARLACTQSGSFLPGEELKAVLFEDFQSLRPLRSAQIRPVPTEDLAIEVFDILSAGGTLVEYLDRQTGQPVSLELSPACAFYVNGVLARDFSLPSLSAYYGTVHFSKRNPGGGYDADTVYICDYQNFVVDEVNTASGFVTAKLGDMPAIVFNEANTSHVSTLADREGRALNWASLTENDVLAVQRTEENGVTLVRATLVRDTVTGRVEGINEQEASVTIGGTKYWIAGRDLSVHDFPIGMECTFYPDLFGRIAYMDVDFSAGGRYGYVLKAGASAGWGRGFDVALFTAEGGFETFTTADKIRVNGVLVDADQFVSGAGDSFIANSYQDIFDLKSGFDARVVKYGINNQGYLNSITFAGGASGFSKKAESSNASFDGERERFNIGGNVYINNATVILRVTETAADNDYAYSSSGYERISPAALAGVEATGLYAAAYNVNSNTGLAGLVVVEGNTLRGSAKGVALVSWIGQQNNSAGNTVDSFTVFTNARGNDYKPITYLAAPDAFISPDVRKGSVISLILNNAGELAETGLVVTVDSMGVPAFNTTYDNNSYFFGRVLERRASRLTLEGGFEEIIPTSANIYLYDAKRSGTASAPASGYGVISAVYAGGMTRYYDEYGTEIAADVYALAVADRYGDIIDVVFFITR